MGGLLAFVGVADFTATAAVFLPADGGVADLGLAGVDFLTADFAAGFVLTGDFVFEDFDFDAAAPGLADFFGADFFDKAPLSLPSRPPPLAGLAAVDFRGAEALDFAAFFVVIVPPFTPRSACASAQRPALYTPTAGGSMNANAPERPPTRPAEREKPARRLSQEWRVPTSWRLIRNSAAGGVAVAASAACKVFVSRGCNHALSWECAQGWQRRLIPNNRCNELHIAIYCGPQYYVPCTSSPSERCERSGLDIQMPRSR